MPFYRIILHGEGINISDGVPVGLSSQNENVGPIEGFYTTRVVRAKNEVEALTLAKAIVIEEWAKPPYSLINRGKLPVLSLDTIYQQNFFQSRKPPRKGYTFYSYPIEEN